MMAITFQTSGKKVALLIFPFLLAKRNLYLTGKIPSIFQTASRHSFPGSKCANLKKSDKSGGYVQPFCCRIIYCRWKYAEFFYDSFFCSNYLLLKAELTRQQECAKKVVNVKMKWENDSQRMRYWWVLERKTVSCFESKS